MGSTWDELSQAISDLNEELAMAKLSDLLNNNRVDNIEKIIRVCQQGVENVGEKYARGEYSVPHLIVAGDLLKRIVSNLPSYTNNVSKIKGKVILGTVYGDIHDIGKDIVASLLEASGFEVIDIGVDAPEERFIEEVVNAKAQIVGMSALLTSALKSMKKTVDALERAGLRKNIKIIIGGNAVSELARKYIGADAFTRNAFEGVRICRRWITEFK